MPQKTDPSIQSFSRFILFGEDDIDDQELLKEVFASVDDSFRILFANTGEQVLSALGKLNDEQLPCLIVLDYNMPILNGADILKELNNGSRYTDIPRIIWSTSGSETFKNICLELGATDYIIKPSNLKEMEDIVRYMLSLCMV
ncbi:MAG TPA: response regulator [Chitinophagaceae bacterium]|nr:response regulator [Chitinophagaceae bacterium]